MFYFCLSKVVSERVGGREGGRERGERERGVLFNDAIFFWRSSRPVGQGLLIREVSRSHTTTHHSR